MPDSRSVPFKSVGVPIEHDELVLECFRQLWGYTDDIMFIMMAAADDEFLLYTCNDTARRVMKLDPGTDVRNLNIRDVWSGEVVEFIYDSYRRAMADRKPVVLERKLIDENDQISTWHTLLVPLLNEEGEPAYIGGVARNVTALKDAEKAATLARQQAEIYNKALSRINESLEAKVFERTAELMRANSAKQRFLANVSHELRTPLTAIIGHTDSLLMGDFSAEEVREAASYIHSNSRHLLDLMNDVLDISKIEAGKLELETGPVNLLSLFRDVEAIMASQAKAKDLEFVVSYCGPIPEIVHVDEIRFKQILLNLTSNAVKFTEVGEVSVQVSFSGNTLSVEVRDTGIGINKEQQKELFSAFSQTDNSITRRYGGTGLGLNLSQQFARLMNGDIEVESQLGLGSTFRVTVEVEQFSGQADVLEGKQSVAVIPQRQFLPKLSGRVLVAEDQPENNRLFCRLLERMGLEVSAVFNGREAVNLVSSSVPFDLVLMDVQMPVMSGLDALQEFHAMECRTPVVALTANVMSDDVERYKAAGFDDYIGKPFELQQFVSIIEKHLGSPQEQALQPVGLAKEEGQTDLKAMLRRRFPEYHQNIRSSWDELNLGTLKGEVHQLKGASLLFDFPAVGEVCRELEMMLTPVEGRIELSAIEPKLQKLLSLLQE
jgi:signal transduction histidine kinase/DNA-binding response OmpR family regulator